MKHPCGNLNRKRPGNRGVTLVEILMAITIVGVLALILVATTKKSIGAAHRTECVSNLHQIMAAALLYAGEHNGDFPVTDDPASGVRGSNPPYNTGLMDQLLPYASKEKIFYCADRRSGTYSYPVQSARTSQRFRQMGYYWACSRSTSALQLTPTLPQKTTGSGQRAMMGCLTGLGGITYPHDGNINVAFADGHVARMVHNVQLSATYFDAKTLLLKDKYNR